MGWLQLAVGGCWVGEAEAVPRWAGLTYADPCLRRYRAHLVGWHWVVRGARALWWSVRLSGVITARSAALSAMFAHGLEVGEQRGDRQGYARGFTEGRLKGDRDGYARGFAEGEAEIFRRIREQIGD